MKAGSGKKLVFVAAALALSAVACLCLAGCSRSGGAVDPGQWGYDCTVTYDALGGVVNTRGVRTTFYMENSYVFEPSGSANMLVTPERDGYLLAGWYTAKQDVANADGTTSYEFSGADRWDFELDRVQEDMTLYARWIPRGKVNYVDAGTGETIFSKNITADSPVQALSDAVLSLSGPKNKTLYGYYADEACTVPYDFAAYQHSELVPDDAALYAQLAEEFPQYLTAQEYVAPETDETDEDAALQDTSYLFIEKLGYALLDTSDEALAALRTRKDALIEESIDAYLSNTASRTVYMKFIDGNFVTVSVAGDMKVGGSCGFFDTDALGNTIDGYIFLNDVDFSGATFAVSESFSGIVYGEGHTLSNITLSAKVKKVDTDTEKSLALAAVMDGATFNDVVFENFAIEATLRSGIKFTSAFLALEGKNVTLNNCVFRGLSVKTGSADDGKAVYTIGDLFGTETACTLNGCEAEPVDVTASEYARIRFRFLEQLEKPKETAEAGTGVNP